MRRFFNFLKFIARFELVALVVILLFSVIGFWAVTNSIHEYSHYEDYQQINATTLEICGFNLPYPFSLKGFWNMNKSAYYTFTYNYSDEGVTERYEKIKEYTEKKAERRGFIFNSIFLAVFAIVMFIIVVSRVDIYFKSKFAEQILAENNREW